jgi:3-hydroxybutyryl-CoA dehydratase
VPQIGETFTQDLTLTREQISSFARLSGDLNPLHHDLELAQGTRFGELIASGTQTVAILMGMVPTHFSQNHSTVGLEFTFKFRRAVKALEPLRLTWSVTGIKPKASLGGELVTLEGCISDLNGETLLESQGTILITGAL